MLNWHTFLTFTQTKTQESICFSGTQSQARVLTRWLDSIYTLGQPGSLLGTWRQGYSSSTQPWLQKWGGESQMVGWNIKWTSNTLGKWEGMEVLRECLWQTNLFSLGGTTPVECLAERKTIKNKIAQKEIKKENGFLLSSSLQSEQKAFFHKNIP